MNINVSLLQYILAASPVVKIVLLILLLASLFSWVIIFQKAFYLRWVKRTFFQFEQDFWQTENLSKLYQDIAQKEEVSGGERIFAAGFKEFMRIKKHADVDSTQLMDSVRRAMRVAYMQVESDLENHLGFLATVGSTSPYIGLFGTVWGIMMAFQALGHVTQATISMVAPGISEALIATALGLFAAIPAVIAYNRYVNKVDHLLGRYDAFQEEFANYLVGFKIL